jgi:hypothetical protein
VRVWWLAPPPALDRHLNLVRRIARKARLQLSLATPRTAIVGQAARTGAMLDDRERLLDGPTEMIRGWTLTAGSPVAVLRFPGRRGDVFQLLSGNPTETPASAVERVLATPAMTVVAALSPQWIARRLRQLCGALDRAPVHPMARSLSRTVTRRAREVSHRRSIDHLDLLDRVLQGILLGLPVGAERELTDILSGDSIAELRNWCVQWLNKGPELGTPELLALVALPAEEVSGYIRVDDRSRNRYPSTSAGATGF